MKRSAIPPPKEDSIQVAILNAFDHVLPGWHVNHVPNGGKRSKATGALMKKLGVKAGFPDLLMFPPTGGLGHLLEVKRPGECPRKNQREMIGDLRGRGCKVEVARSVDEAVEVFKRWKAEYAASLSLPS